ncbi:MAG: MurR/RpiR family transcriptional regulator [Bacillus sp. (in: firmicutes)]
MRTFNWNTKSMSPIQYRIADYIQKNTQQVLLSTEQEIADAVKVSIASVSRFWRCVGYKNFKDFKGEIASQLEVSPAGKMKHVMRMMEKEALEYHTLNASINHLYKTVEQFQKSTLKQTVNLLASAKTIYVHCPGPSLGLGELMKYRMARYGMDLRIIHKGGSELLEDLLHFTKEDVVILFGFIRLLPEAQVILDDAQQVGYKTIIITDQLVSEFSAHADIVLFSSRGEIREFHSMIAPVLLIENLIIAIGLEHQEENVRRLEQLSKLRNRYSAELPR